jgi:hypothetical protein
VFKIKRPDVVTGLFYFKGNYIMGPQISTEKKTA